MRTRSLVFVAVLVALVLSIAAAAQAATTTYVVRAFTEPASSGLAVKKPLDEFRAVSGARVIVPSDWRPLTAKAGQLRVLTPGTTCRYRVTFTVRTRLGAPGDAVDRVTAALPAAGPGYLLDSGQREGAAFRVVRKRISAGLGVRVDAIWADVLTKRKDIVPSGQVAWTDVRVTATSLPGNECHSGTYREVLGPRLGDALAAAHARLKFVRR
jgi:hypothetical protein